MQGINRLVILIAALFGFAFAAPVASGITGSTLAVSAAHADDDDDEDGVRKRRGRYAPAWQQRRDSAAHGHARRSYRDDDDDDDGVRRGRTYRAQPYRNDDDD